VALGIGPRDQETRTKCSGTPAPPLATTGMEQSLSDGSEHFEVEPASRAVGIHRVHDDLAGTKTLAFAYPFEKVEPGGAASTMTGHLEPAGGVACASPIHGENDAL
jgi:hypothetical protein